VTGWSIQFARAEWVYYVLPGGLLALGLMIWLGVRLRRGAVERFVPRGAERILLRHDATRRAVKLSVTAAALALLCVALARPQWGHETVNLPRGGADILVLFDVSNSMLVEDMQGSRLRWGRRKIDTLIDELARDPVHRIGLMPFAGEPFLVVPPTPDYDAVRFFLEDLNPRSVGFGGSDLAAAIDRAAEQLVDLPGTDKAILVVSDGEAIDANASGAVQAARADSRKRALEAARDARLKATSAGKRLGIYALGVGGGVMKEVAVPDDRGGTSYVRYRGASGEEQVATSALDERTLAGVAYDNSGYAHSTQDDTDILFLIRSGLTSGGAPIDEGGGERSIPIERFRMPLLAAFVLLLVELFIREGRGEAVA
jgi:Ca-activated chloride channel family protein